MKARTNFFFVAVLGLLALCGPAWAIEGSAPIQGVISYWTFDESEGTTAYDWVGENHGTIYGAEWTTGQVYGALSFDGDRDYVMVGDKDNLEPQELTLCFWAKLNNPSGSLQGGIAKGWVFGNYAEYSYQFKFHNGQASAAINTSNGTFQVNALVDDGWHMWSMTVGDGILSIYRDGVFQENKEYTGAIDYTKSHNNFVIGARDNGNYAFNGTIDEVAIYNRALSPGEVQQLYQNGLGGHGYPVDFRIIAINKIEHAIAEKIEALETIDAVLEKEWAAYEALEQLLESGDYGDLNYGDIVKAKQKIYSAIQHQEQSIDALEKSIEKLEDALAALGFGLEPRSGQ